MPIAVEILEVLQRPILTRKYKSLQKVSPAEILSLFKHAELVEVPSIPDVYRDPKDDKYLAAAKAGRAAYVVSADIALRKSGVPQRCVESIQVPLAPALPCAELRPNSCPNASCEEALQIFQERSCHIQTKTSILPSDALPTFIVRAGIRNLGVVRPSIDQKLSSRVVLG